MSASWDGRLSVAISGAMLAQTVAALLWAGAAAERLDQLQVRIARSEDIAERVARLEEQGDHIQSTLIRIERKLDDNSGGLR
ncbi:hypothetical protein [Parvularcula sp. LCG005]|uniref:hypothetical protein n=1 Tax=Parvularcula sp. LCG005 TaxID=3078805 RepID=UPI002942A4B6|nr:hypothetical protein [Parvularcula sp. LCG005]WOI53991.1 hypothetical protein RUI03_03055 [Parvularcula sp. LCG005]